MAPKCQMNNDTESERDIQLPMFVKGVHTMPYMLVGLSSLFSLTLRRPYLSEYVHSSFHTHTHSLPFHFTRTHFSVKRTTTIMTKKRYTNLHPEMPSTFILWLLFIHILYFKNKKLRIKNLNTELWVLFVFLLLLLLLLFMVRCSGYFSTQLNEWVNECRTKYWVFLPVQHIYSDMQNACLPAYRCTDLKYSCLFIIIIWIWLWWWQNFSLKLRISNMFGMTLYANVCLWNNT